MKPSESKEMSSFPPTLPQVGHVAHVRNRRGIVTAVEPFDAPPEGRFHLVTVEYTDSDGVDADRLLWEREPGARVLPPTALPRVVDHDPMPSHEFDAMVRAARWSAVMPYIDPDESGPLDRLPISSPFHGAIQVEDFQLVPLLKALRMPRISMLIADDVGLGKTIEAGLILKELLLRRRIRKVLILSPASLQRQWQQEMQEKFSLTFDQVDRDQTHALRRRIGLDANPWRTFPRIIASYYYLRQPNVLEEFLSASRPHEGSGRLAWDLLIVDEAHNLAPAPFGADSDLSRTLQQIAPYFEHKIFLTATPHNGQTSSFSGLLEMLDPVRFTRTAEMQPAEKARIPDVLVRRLKSEINAANDSPLFCERTLEEIPLTHDGRESALSEAFASFRKRVREIVSSQPRGEQLAGTFAVEILGKRLLSSSASFADSWFRYLEGSRAPDEADAREVRAAEVSVRQETTDDREAESRTGHAATTVGSWLKPLAARVKAEVDQISTALDALGFTTEKRPIDTNPKKDTRFDALCALIDQRLRKGDEWRSDERIVVFTEYKTTLDYLKRRLRQQYKDERRAIRVLFGGMDNSDGEGTFDGIKADFNDPKNAVRVLIATDAASEGLNLQQTARLLLHYDIPWNPSRMEQRNGRIDRHGQPRDVTIFHFTSDDDADLRFLAHVLRKVNTIREDLGSVADVFDAALHERFIEGKDVKEVEIRLESREKSAKGRAVIPGDSTATTKKLTGEEEFKKLQALRAELDLDPDTLRQTLEVALSAGAGSGQIVTRPDGKWSLRTPIPPAWETVVEDHVRIRAGDQAGALPSLVFDPDALMEQIGPRKVFRSRADTSLLHLGHPLFQKVLTTFARYRFTQGDGGQRATRWTVRRGAVPTGADGLILLSTEQLAVNELRETFHHWVRTLALPIRNGKLLEPMEHVPATRLRIDAPVALKDLTTAREMWEELEDAVKAILSVTRTTLTGSLRAALAEEGSKAVADEQQRFKSRHGELSAMIQENSLQKLEDEIARIDAEIQQGRLFEQEQKLTELRASKSAKEEELRRRSLHLEELRDQLSVERKRVLEQLLPKRFAMNGEAQVFPVTVEIRLPEVTA